MRTNVDNVACTRTQFNVLFEIKRLSRSKSNATKKYFPFIANSGNISVGTEIFYRFSSLSENAKSGK